MANKYTSGINKVNVKKKWSKIADQLNALRPPTRTNEDWIKVTADHKFKIKKNDSQQQIRIPCYSR